MSNAVYVENPNLDKNEIVYLYHFTIDSKTTNLEEKFGDTKFVIMGGKNERMKIIAKKLYDGLKGKEI